MASFPVSTDEEASEPQTLCSNSVRSSIALLAHVGMLAITGLFPWISISYTSYRRSLHGKDAPDPADSARYQPLSALPVLYHQLVPTAGAKRVGYLRAQSFLPSQVLTAG